MIIGTNSMDETTFERKWYVVRTKPRWEKKVASQIFQKEIEIYLPVIEKIRVWSDRKKKIEDPMFSGYVFVFGNEEERYHAISNTAGAMGYVFYNKRPAIIRPEEIDYIKLSLKAPERVTIEEKQIKKGDFITVKRGPFRGMKGYVNDFKGSYKLTVNLEELSTAFSVILMLDEVEVEEKNREEE
jgi:transcription antitermination factor NusG